ncbi:hypothetical protein PO909_006574 [Leuciscus waleckii]
MWKLDTLTEDLMKLKAVYVSVVCSERTHRQQPWIALIKKGNCTYSQKVQAAKKEGASAVVIYNIDGTGNATNLMAHSGMTVSLIGKPRQFHLFQSSFTENTH